MSILRVTNHMLRYIYMYMYQALPLQETPFIAVADSPELDSSDDGDEASNKTKLYLVKVYI